MFEADGKKLLSELENKNLVKEFDFNNSYDYTQMLKDQILAKNDSWGIRWYASVFLKDKLTLYPSYSFVQNIVFKHLCIVIAIIKIKLFYKIFVF